MPSGTLRTMASRAPRAPLSWALQSLVKSFSILMSLNSGFLRLVIVPISQDYYEN